MRTLALISESDIEYDFSSDISCILNVSDDLDIQQCWEEWQATCFRKKKAGKNLTKKRYQVISFAQFLIQNKGAVDVQFERVDDGCNIRTID